MANIVLVHGAWHGGWCYRDTAKALRAMGHEVFTPTNTGVGEKFHHSSEGITLETHVRDIIGVIEAEELDDVILCGHSYGGMIVTVVADRVPERIKAIVYIDALVPEDGETLLDTINASCEPEFAAAVISGWRGSVTKTGMMEPTSAEAFGVFPQYREWVDRRCRPQSASTFYSQALLSHKECPVSHRMYVYGTAWGPSPFPYFGNKFSGKPGWRIETLPAGHDIMVDMPVELAGLIDSMTK